MKIKLLLFTLLFTTFVNAQVDPIVYIPDANFKAKLLSASEANQIASTQTLDVNGNVTTYTKIDTNDDGEIQQSEADAIKYLDVSYETLSNLSGISNFNNLMYLNCNTNQLTSLDVSGLTNLTSLYCSTNQLTSLDVSGLTNLTSLYCANNQLASLDLSGLTNLTSLGCFGNQLTSLDVSDLTNLNVLNCWGNQLTSLDLSGLINLTYLLCYDNQLTSLNVSGLINLVFLDCAANQLTSLDVSGLTNLTRFSCAANQLTSLDVSSLTNLIELYCNTNQLTNLSVSGFAKLIKLKCFNNQLTSLDVSGNLSYLECDNNQLTSLFIKNNNTKWDALGFSNNPNLTYICANDKDLAFINQQITQYGYSNCHANTYCSFNPRGEFYTIKGEVTLDFNSNGCDVNDFVYPNLRFNITDGINNGGLIADASGMYSIPVQKGTHTITPQFERPDYFTVSPSIATISFPTEISPFTQDFCITPDGVKNDLEVTIVPINRARPGFDAEYKIKYKNKGNTIQSGSVTLTFDDAVLDVVLSNPSASIATSLLTWNFTGLKPLETGEILVSFNLNSPLETPALNGGDTLSYTATVTGATDETVEDNVFTLNQTVVNSFDPNDKTCLEGDVITPDKVGQFVHYQIRFENTGTAEAINIVVKDIIDATKFDVSTLAITDYSHEMYTRINGNTVEFIFENINLPFDDATNDGYLVFKIKTKPTVILGDILKNKAEIYFDYNFPIITNEYKTTVQNNPLSTSTLELTNALSIYPNPVKDILNIQSKETVLKLEVFDMAGRKLSVNAVTNNQTNLSHLASGNYIAKLYTEKGVKQIKILME